MKYGVIPPAQKTGLIGGEVLSAEAIAEAVRAGYVPVVMTDTRTRQQRRRDDRRAEKEKQAQRNAHFTRKKK